jgi:hypothetical protein
MSDKYEARKSDGETRCRHYTTLIERRQGGHQVRRPYSTEESLTAVHIPSPSMHSGGI